MCERCAELEERVAWLESELGLQRDATALARLGETFRRVVTVAGGGGGPHQAAEVVLALYAARGRVVTRMQLLEAAPSPTGIDRDAKIIDVWVCLARRAIGFDAIVTAWGRGYSLSDAGAERVRSIIAPQEAAA